MAMVIQNNVAAQLVLGELNKNNDKLRKSLEKVSSGQKIVGAKDDASGYSISEEMRVRIRALNQADQNVKNGGSLLKTAEAGIQQQIELVRTIREKVIDANNDTNTDEDRKIMQKELDQLYNQIDQTAYYTDYNTQKVLLGNTYWKTISKWVKVDHAVLDESSVMNIIPDIYDKLDGIEGPFNIFRCFGTDTATIPSFYGTDTEKEFANGTAGNPSKIEYDFNKSYSGATIPDDLDGMGFSVTGVTSGGSRDTVKYVLTTNPTKVYNGNYIKINISGATTLSDVANAIKAVIDVSQGNSFVVNSTGGVLTLTSKNDRTQQNKNISIDSSSAPAKSVTPSGRQGATSSGLTTPQYLDNGTNNVYQTKVLTEDRYVYNKATDRLEFVPGKSESFLVKKGTKAELANVNISGCPDGSGVVLQGSSTAYVKFTNGSTITQDSDGVWLVGINASGSATVAGMTLSVDSGQMTLTALSIGDYPNKRYGIVADSFPQIPQGQTINYSAVTSLSTQKDTGSGGDWTFTAGTDGDTAYVDTLDLSAYNTNNPTQLDNFINDLKGKDIRTEGLYISFIDTTVPYSMEAMSKSGYNIDLKELRQAVQSGANILDAFEKLMKSKIPSRCEVTVDNSGNQVFRIYASQPGIIGNSEKLYLSESHLAHYNVDFKSWFASHADLLQPSVPEYLDGKSIRVYCATCPEQWYNLEFCTPESLAQRPESTSDEDFTPIFIDVSNVTDYKSLVQEIYNQGAPQFQLINHFTYMAANPNDGIVTFFDNRAFDPTVPPESWHYPYLQEKGAKIADGAVRDIIKVDKDLLERRIVIHDTDKASMHIKVRIPDMKVSSIFGIMPDYEKSDIREYSLVSDEDRSALLGRPPTLTGLLDEGLNYLLDAVVIVGAQNARLDHTEANLTVQIENTIASESTIRDADMAKEMTEYTKYNILTQSAQAMLAQANQNSSAVLSLLQ